MPAHLHGLTSHWHCTGCGRVVHEHCCDPKPVPPLPPTGLAPELARDIIIEQLTAARQAGQSWKDIQATYGVNTRTLLHIMRHGTGVSSDTAAAFGLVLTPRSGTTRKPTGEPKLCAWCAGAFAATVAWQRTCGKECGRLLHNQTRAAAKRLQTLARTGKTVE